MTPKAEARSEALAEYVRQSQAELRLRGYEQITPQELMRRARGFSRGRCPVVRDYGSAMARMRDPARMKSLLLKEQRTRADLDRVHPLMRQFEKAFLRVCDGYNVPMFVASAWRGAEEQNALFAKGRSRAAALQSPHNFGMALDIVHSRFGWELSRNEWNIIGELGYEAARRANVRVKWGGEFRSIYDPAHWELRDWRDLSARHD